MEKSERISVLPVSVVDIGAQDATDRRDGTNHAKDSSRAQYSHFPKEIADLSCELYLRGRQLVYDPFAGWGERAAACRDHGIPYVGQDVSQVSIEAANRVYGVEHVHADSRIEAPFQFDALWTCPPYWNLERYSPGGLDALPTWERFLSELEEVYHLAYSRAKPGAMFVVYVGDWRAKHRYYDLTYEHQRMFREMGLEPFDMVVGSRAKVTKIKILIPQAVRLGYTVKLHETLLVYRKPL